MINRNLVTCLIAWPRRLSQPTAMFRTTFMPFLLVPYTRIPISRVRRLLPVNMENQLFRERQITSKLNLLAILIGKLVFISPFLTFFSFLLLPTFSSSSSFFFLLLLFLPPSLLGFKMKTEKRTEVNHTFFSFLLIPPPAPFSSSSFFFLLGFKMKT